MADAAPRYPIRTVAARTGLSAHVLRVWERRYGAVSPSRSTGPRLYSEAEIERLRLLKTLVDSGIQIGQLAPLPSNELRELVARHARSTPSESLTDDALTREMHAVMNAVTQLDGQLLEQLLRRAAIVFPLRVFAERLVVPVLHRAGALWASSDICPAHEHLLSATVSRVLDWLVDSLPTAPPGREAIAVTPSGQRHEFGARIAALVAMEEGWRVTYLGADLPAQDIAVAARARNAQVVLLSAPIEDDAANSLVRELQALRGALGETVQLLIGGAGAQVIDVERSGVTFVASYDDLRLALRSGGNDTAG